MEPHLGPGRPVLATDDELVHLRALERVLVEQDGVGPTIIAPDGGSVPVPRTLNRLLQEITHILARGDAADVTAYPRELTLVEAAEMINESEDVVQELVRSGQLPITRDKPTRVSLADVRDYRDERNAERRQALEDLIQLNQDMGLYAKR
jgi:hypothetical protein